MKLIKLLADVFLALYATLSVLVCIYLFAIIIITGKEYSKRTNNRNEDKK